MLAAFALLLIAGGAVGAAYLVVQNGHRVAAIEIVQPVGAGQQIPLGAMREVQIAPGGTSYVSWNEASQVSQFYAATVLPPGTLLSAAMVTRSANLASGREVVGLALKDGQLPDGLTVGDKVAVYETSDSAQSCPGTPGATLSPNAVVLGIGTPPAAAANSSTDVRVAVYPGAAGAVTCNAANGNVSIALLPPGRSRVRIPTTPSAPPSSPPAGRASGAPGQGGTHPRGGRPSTPAPAPTGTG